MFNLNNLKTMKQDLTAWTKSNQKEKKTPKPLLPSLSLPTNIPICFGMFLAVASCC